MKRGVSLSTLVATTVIIIILITVVTISGAKMSDNIRKTSFALEIKTIQQSIDSYLHEHQNEYPTAGSIVLDLSNVSSKNQFTDNGDIITNNTISLFVIDYTKIGYTNLKYGNKKDGKNDIYVLSGITGKVYYAKGFKVGNQVYYTLTPELEKVLEYKTSETLVDNGNEIILYKQEDVENSQKKVIVKIPVSYTVTSVRVGETNYTATSSDKYNIYEVTGVTGNVIDIIYTYDGKIKSTSYTIR